MNHIWVIEYWDKDTKKWEPTLNTHFARTSARKKQYYILKNIPKAKTRVRKYIST